MRDLATNPLIFRALTFWVFRLGMLNDIELINKRTANDPNPFLRDTVPDSLKVRLSPMQARTILSQLSRVEPHLQKRVETARLYHEGLRDLPGVLLPPMDEDGADGFIVFPIQVEDRAALLVHLMKMGRDCASYFYKNCADYGDNQDGRACRNFAFSWRAHRSYPSCNNRVSKSGLISIVQ